MSKFILVVISTLLFSTCVSCQDETKAIRAALDGYISGTAHNDPEAVLSSFMPGAQMFLYHSDNPLYILTVEEYAERVGRSPKGEHNGRVTNIISIDQVEDIATAKLEVIIPGLDRHFTDLLLLKKLEGSWKIISKSATSSVGKRPFQKVIIALSNADKYGDSDLPAGNSFVEVATAYDVYTSNGYHVDMVSPDGGEVPLAYVDAYDTLHRKYMYDTDFMHALSHTLTPTDVNPEEYDIIQFTGGSAPINDLPDNEQMQDLAMSIYENNNGVIVAVCHGSAALINLKTSDDRYLVDGKTVNGSPDDHEYKEGKYYPLHPFIIENELKKRGANFQYGPKATSYIEVDGRLVTGQNFQSSRAVSEKSIEVSQKCKKK